MAYIYKIQNTKNGKYYIGSTNEYAVRIPQHIRDLDKQCHHNYRLQRDWDRYGKECFEFSILEEVPNDKKFQIEQEYLNSLVGKEGQIYNICRTSIGGLALSFHPYIRKCKVCYNRFKTFDLKEYFCSVDCEMKYDFFPDEFDDDERGWRESNYEYKDIDDWDVDDHLAAWHDHMMEK